VPLSREEFDQRRIDVAFPIANLLAGFPDRALTAGELRQLLIEVEARVVTLEDIEQALATLVSQSRVEETEIGGQRWYIIIRRRLGFLTE
jgi:hypothetical protein